MFYKLIAPRSTSHYILNLRNVTRINRYGKNLSIEFINHSGSGFLTYFNMDHNDISVYYDTEEDCIKEFNNIYNSVQKYNNIIEDKQK